ncbi:TPA: hypothetical protein ACGGIY_004538, partial [Escherichia coli]
MFTAFNERNDFSYAFEKIRNAISAPGENNVYAATELGLGILGNDSNLLIVFYVQIMPDDFV